MTKEKIKLLCKNVFGNNDFTQAEKMTAATHAANDFDDFMQYVNMQAIYDTCLLYSIDPVVFLTAHMERKDEMAREAMETKKKEMGIDIDSNNPADLIKALIKKLEDM